MKDRFLHDDWITLHTSLANPIFPQLTRSTFLPHDSLQFRFGLFGGFSFCTTDLTYCFLCQYTLFSHYYVLMIDLYAGFPLSVVHFRSFIFSQESIRVIQRFYVCCPSKQNHAILLCIWFSVYNIFLSPFLLSSLANSLVPLLGFSKFLDSLLKSPFSFFSS